MGQSSVKPEGYLPRIVDEQVERYLRIFGAVEIEGTKWCGKTWTARQHGASISYVDEQLALAQDDPSLMLLGEKPHIIDEWQRVPAIWNLVRHGIDETRGLRGGWILTGSSTPPDRQGDAEAAKRHSGAGRIGRIKMSPMTLSESGDSENIVGDSWHVLTARINFKFSRAYGKKGPVLTFIEDSPCEVPEQPVATFY